MRDIRLTRTSDAGKPARADERGDRDEHVADGRSVGPDAQLARGVSRQIGHRRYVDGREPEQDQSGDPPEHGHRHLEHEDHDDQSGGGDGRRGDLLPAEVQRPVTGRQFGERTEPLAEHEEAQSGHGQSAPDHLERHRVQHAGQGQQDAQRGERVAEQDDVPGAEPVRADLGGQVEQLR